MGLGNTLNILRPPDTATQPIQTGWNEDLVKNMHNVLGEMSQQITATATVSAASMASFDTKVDLEAATVPLVVDTLQLTGYTTAGDGGGALYKRVVAEPSHTLKVQSAEGAWWELVPDPEGINVKQGGAKGDDTANDATALNNVLATGSLDSSVVLSTGIYLTDTALVGEENPFLLTGRGWQIAGDNTISGSVLKASGTGVANLLTIQSATPGDGGSTDVGGVALRDFALFHRGSGDGLLINNVVRARVSNLHIDCNNEGAVGLHIDNWGFFSTFEKLIINRFIDVGILIEGVGTQHIIRDCHVESSNAAAVAALHITRGDFLVDGGQYNVNLAGNTGIGILVDTVDAGFLVGGRILNTIAETDIAIKITGNTNPFSSVFIGYPCWNMGALTKGVIFDKAFRCLLFMPQIIDPTGGGTMAEWGAGSKDCGVICDSKAATGAYIVNGSALRPWVRVTGVLSTTEWDAVTTATNLTVTIENVDGYGEVIHNGVAWDTVRVNILDAGFVAITPPFSAGVVEVTAGGGVLEYILAGYSTVVADMSSLVTGASGEVDLTDGTLDGTTGNPGKITVRTDSTSGDVYVENRMGGTRDILIKFRKTS